MTTLRAVIVARIGDGRNPVELERVGRERLAAVSRVHRRQGWIAGPWAPWGADGFEGTLKEIRHIPRVVFDLRRRFRPRELHLGVGVGIAAPGGSPELPGTAGSEQPASLARVALHGLGRGGLSGAAASSRSPVARKYRHLTAFRSTDRALDDTVNVVFRLVDTLLQRITERQWETIAAYEATAPRPVALGPDGPAGRQDRAAERLGVDESTVSRSLSRAHYWQVLDAVGALTAILERWQPPSEQIRGG